MTDDVRRGTDDVRRGDSKDVIAPQRPDRIVPPFGNELDSAALAQSARATKLIGSKIFNGDTAVGQIDDVMIHLTGGVSPAVVLALGGFLGIGEKRVAIPLSHISVDSEARYTTDLTQAQLEAAPTFDVGTKHSIGSAPRRP